jgi:DNA-binding MarR family transcriptional regulator
MSRLLDLTTVAHLIGAPARLKMLAALHTEGELTAGDLAAVAGVSRQTASAHLSKLEQGGLITRVYGACGTYGTYGARHRVFRLLDGEVATAVAALVALATAEPGEPRAIISRHDATVCYGHLGGTLGNALFMALLERSLLEPIVRTLYDYRVTAEGAAMLRNFGIDTALLQKQRRHFARRCLNTPEANAHLSGSLADALHKGLLERRWLEQDKGRSRVLVLTEAGRDGLAGHFALYL